MDGFGAMHIVYSVGEIDEKQYGTVKVHGQYDPNVKLTVLILMISCSCSLPLLCQRNYSISIYLSIERERERLSI